jgi:ABC-type transport system involved in cytochrome c biogenesis permease subunit
MKRLHWFIAAAAVVWLLSAFRAPKDPGFAYHDFGRLPLVFNGRLQPFDSFARNTLLQIRNKQSMRDSAEKRTLPATEWAVEVMMKPDVANARKAFRIDHPDLKGQLKLAMDADEKNGEDGKHYSWNQLMPSWQEVQEQAEKAPEDASKHSAYDRAVLKLRNAMGLYAMLQATLQPPRTTNFPAELAAYQASIPAGVTALRDRLSGRPFDTNAMINVLEYCQRYLPLSSMRAPLIIPPHHPELARDQWMKVGDALFEPGISPRLLRQLMGEEDLSNADYRDLITQAGTGKLHPAVGQFAAMSDAYQNGRVADFNQLVSRQLQELSGTFGREITKASREQVYNDFAPFMKSMVLYVVAFLFSAAFWFTFSDWTRRSASALIWIAFIVHSAALITRMWLEGRPPVTNLYSSAIFIGWGSVGLGLLLESIWKNAIGLATGSVLAFVTLIVAHNLSLGGDTLEMMQAVLDTNFWLATHVVIVTLGYSATYFAGFLALLYVVLGVGTRALTQDMARGLTRMVYGILCFATLASFVGTVLGGIWADQSWGRFWGWDPKENGALIIVLWNALILHVRWGGMVKERGLHLLTIGGNIVTSWSWFGTNLLGIGLHSYGFMSAAFWWLIAFAATQLVIIAAGLIVPQASWISFRTHPPAPGTNSRGPSKSPTPQSA